MDRNVRGGTLLIKTTGDQPEVEISGSSADIMFNWTALTHQVSKTLNIPPGFPCRYATAFGRRLPTHRPQV